MDRTNKPKATHFQRTVRREITSLAVALLLHSTLLKLCFLLSHSYHKINRQIDCIRHMIRLE